MKAQLRSQRESCRRLIQRGKPIQDSSDRRLLGPNGLSLLVKQANQFKVRGKGQEVRAYVNLSD